MIDNIPGNSFGENISMGDEANRVKTGIEGFDDICGGGMLRDRTYLVSGNSGAGKTNFAIQFIYNGIVKYNENGLIVATEENPSISGKTLPPSAGIWKHWKMKASWPLLMPAPQRLEFRPRKNLWMCDPSTCVQ